MREIHVEEIRDNVAQMCIDAAYHVSDDVLTAFDRALETETAQSAKEILSLLKENARIAREEHHLSPFDEYSRPKRKIFFQK